MKTTIAELMLIAVHACSLCSGGEPASLAPIYELTDTYAADPPATLQPIYDLCKDEWACGCANGGECDCGDDCQCENCKKHSTKATGKLSPDAQARYERNKSGRRTQWLMFTADWCNACKESKADFAPWLEASGWRVDETPQAHVRLVIFDKADVELIRTHRVTKLPTFILVHDGKEVDRAESYPGRENLAKRYAAAATGKPIQSASRQGYPVRANWWNHPGSDASHLQSGQHAGKFPQAWVDSLTHAERESLHADDHEGRVKWAYVPKEVAVTKREPIYERRKVCDGNGCRYVNVITGYRDVAI